MEYSSLKRYDYQISGWLHKRITLLTYFHSIFLDEMKLYISLYSPRKVLWGQNHKDSFIGQGISFAALWPWIFLVHSMIFYWECTVQVEDRMMGKAKLVHNWLVWYYMTWPNMEICPCSSLGLGKFANPPPPSIFNFCDPTLRRQIWWKGGEKSRVVQTWWSRAT